MRGIPCLLLLILVHGVAVPGHSAEAKRPRSIAVLPFRNLRPDEATDSIGQRAAETITTELTDLIEPPPVESALLKAVIEKEKLRRSDLSDTATAARIARLVGADRVVLGTYGVNGDDVNFTLCVVDARTGATIVTCSTTGSRDRIVDAFLELTSDLVRSFDQKAPTAAEPPQQPEPDVEFLVCKRTTLFDGRGYAWISRGFEVSDGYVIVGVHDHKGLFIKLDEKGAKQWERTYSYTRHDQLYGARQTRDGGYILVGSASGEKENDGLLVKTSAKGEEEWHRVFDGPCDALRGVEEIEGGYVVAGSTTGNELGYVAKTDSTGKKVAEAAFGTPKSLNEFSSIRRIEGGFLATGCTGSGGWSARHGWAVILDANLGKVRQKIYVSDGFVFLSDALPARGSGDQDGYVLAGMKMSGGYRALLMKVGATLGMEWDKDFGGGDNELNPSLYEEAPGRWVLLTGNGAVFNTWISKIVVAEQERKGDPSEAQ